MKLNVKRLKQMILEQLDAMNSDLPMVDVPNTDSETSESDPSLDSRSELIRVIKNDFAEKVSGAMGIQTAEASLFMQLLDAVLVIADNASLSQEKVTSMVDKMNQIASVQEEI